ncbi:histidinol-phosphate transaminase [Sinomicrobium weinanense]|uniref:Histidinol-phosphate aminotransferase n=1 Tax=Sinomicrobium weinanense TaxID=2842200 RepID=A0A926Q3L1_9FLAO|nr:histidinol-phosphate transaminase [Sinomicrobium weinanense]MBC9797663.1 histidinol-phosphate transaminase [Sinomicrobium weinanense]MBU3122655.1 histidinol-phosphate transaminase [Sinomicrobium weinanense]
MKTIPFDINKLVRPNVAKLKPYSSARDEFKDFDAEMVFIDANENPFSSDVNRYPDPQQVRLKSELAGQKNVRVENILLGNGSDEVLDLLYRAFCEPAQDNILTLPPTYGMYKVLAEVNNVENREILLSKDFQPRVEEVLEKVDDHSRIIFLCSPNNPTGNSFSEGHVKALLESFNGLVVVDEAYIDFSDKESWLSRLDIYPNLVVTQTLSKAYGLAGIRLGICYASPQIIAVLNKIKPPYNINELTQRRALERLRETDVIFYEIHSIKEQKEELFKSLLQVNFVEEVYPSDANFILARVDDANKRYGQLVEKGIVVRNRTTQPLCKNCLRFTVGTPGENEKLIKTLNLL